MNKKSLIGLILFLGYPFLLQLLDLSIILGEVAFWLLFLFIVSWIYVVEKKTMASIGWEKLTAKTVYMGIGLGLVFFFLFGIIMTAIQALGLPLNQDVAQLMASQPFPLLLLIVLRAGVVEEVLYRAYAYERIFEITKSKWLAALIPIILFTLVHLPWGAGHLVFVFFVSTLFMLVYISKRNLGLIMIAHFTTDVLVLLVLPMLAGAQ
jgi:membrane protease YdiL (CAAX protease family)